MMASVNKVILLGHLGRDPEVRYMTNGDAVANFSMATTETWKDKNGEKQEKTEWHRVVCWRRLAEIVGEYVKKGQAIFVEGKLQTRTYEKDGEKRYATEVVADHIQLLGKPNSQRGSDDDGRSSAGSRSAPAASTPASGGDPLEDDIPF